MTYSLCLCIFFLFYSVNSVSGCLDDQCRELEFPGSYFFYGNRLKNHLIRTIDVMDQDSCELSCYIEHNCVSINFEVKASASGTHKCDLNNSTHKEHDKDLVKSPGYIYHGTNNACGKAPCKNNGVCQSGFTSKGYRCLCASGFTGHDCKQARKPTVTTVTTTHAAQTSQQPAECQNYQSLTDMTRKTSYAGCEVHCDKSLGPGWFRFQGAAGSKMPTSCVLPRRCGTHAPGWLNGAHPKITDGKVTRQVCFHWSSNCCKWFTDVQVRNCGSFFIYHLQSTPGRACSLRYCGTGNH